MAHLRVNVGSIGIDVPDDEKEDSTFIPFQIYKRPKNDTANNPSPTRLCTPNSHFVRQKSTRNIFEADINSFDVLQDMEDGVEEGLEYDEICNQFGVDKDDAVHPKLQRQYSSMKVNRESGRIAIERDHYILSRIKSANSETLLSEHKENDIEQWAEVVQNHDDIKITEHEDDEPESPLTGKYKEFRDRIQEKLMDELIDYEKFNAKTAYQLSDEARNLHCCNAQSGNGHSFDLIRYQCPCFKRIHIVMEAYHELIEDVALGQAIQMHQVIECVHYGHQQVIDDFQHILSVHIETDDAEIRRLDLNGQEIRQSIGQQIAIYFMMNFPCGPGMSKCRMSERHWRTRHKSPVFAQDFGARTTRMLSTKDIVFQNECDKIHSYFMQFGVCDKSNFPSTYRVIQVHIFTLLVLFMLTSTHHVA